MKHGSLGSVHLIIWSLTIMEDDQNGGQPIWKTTKIKDDQNWKIEDDQNVSYEAVMKNKEIKNQLYNFFIQLFWSQHMWNYYNTFKCIHRMLNDPYIVVISRDSVLMHRLWIKPWIENHTFFIIFDGPNIRCFCGRIPHQNFCSWKVLEEFQVWV